MVWSPMSNLLLYGATSRVKSARDNGVRIGLGSDWAVSGSKNLLGELKVARLASDDMDTGFTDRDLVAMATRDAAVHPRLAECPRLAAARRARRHHRARRLSRRSLQGAGPRRTRPALSLVMINGVPRFGTTTLMTELARDGRARRHRRPSADALHEAGIRRTRVVAGISLGQAKTTLVDALRRLPALASDLENSRTGPARAMADRIARSDRPVWFLALDELESTGSELRHRLPGAQGRRQRPALGTAPNARAVPLSQLVGPMTLDPLTVADDNDFLDRVEAQTVLARVRPEQADGDVLDGGSSVDR